MQLREYIRLRPDMSMEEAAERSGLSIGEARLTDTENARTPIALPPLTHNQPKEPTMAEGNVAADELRQLIERVENLESEKKALADDIKDVFGEAKARGYDTKTMRRIVALRKMESSARDEAAALLETYAAALGMQLAFL
jgi:uncharacterized protein (UPF0335 family)